MSAVVEHACGLPLVLRAAQAADLPLPEEIVVDEQGATLTFAEFDDVERWAAFLDAPVQRETNITLPIGRVIRDSARATLFDLPVEVLSVDLDVAHMAGAES